MYFSGQIEQKFDSCLMAVLAIFQGNLSQFFRLSFFLKLEDWDRNKKERMKHVSDYILKAEAIKKSFGGVHALKGVSLSIKRGEVHCLAGENGCGKSTLIKVISGFHGADSGQLEIDGQIYEKINPAQAIGAGVQVIYQDFSVFPNLTVMENLALNRELSQKKRLVNWRRFREIAKEAMATIDVHLDLDELVENISVADKQLIAICRALLNNAKLIIMDEPTTALTKKEVDALFIIIRQLKAQGISILFVSHKLDEVFEISDSFTIFRSGEKIFSGETKTLDSQKFAYYMTGREFAKAKPPEALKAKNPVLEVQQLSLKNAFSDISFQINAGEIVGITGLLGSGRTELVQTLFGYRQKTGGQILLDGQNVNVTSVRDGVSKGVGYVPEDRLTEGLFLQQSIKQNILVSKWDELSGFAGLLKQKALDEEAARWINDLSIAAKFPELPVQTLSGGNQQKVVLARWLALQLKILILNGPTVGVDIGAKHDIHQLIRKLAEKGLAVIIISDDLPEILENCHRVLIMNSGKITAEHQASAITQKELGDLIRSA